MAAARAGANSIVAGSSIFNEKRSQMDIPISNMRRSVEKWGNGLAEEEMSEEIRKRCPVPHKQMIAVASMWAVGFGVQWIRG